MRPVVALDESIEEALQKTYDRGVSQMEDFLDGMDEDGIELKSADEEDNTLDIQEMAEGSPAVKLVNLVIYQGIRDRS